MCDLCDHDSFPFYLTFCRTCQGGGKIPMVVSTEHKPHFSPEEKDMIKRMLPDRKIRWQQRKIKNHAHCHILS